MRGKDISDALGGVDGRFVEESAETEKKNLRWLKWTAPVAAAAVIAVTLGVFFGGGRTPGEPTFPVATDPATTVTDPKPTVTDPKPTVTDPKPTVTDPAADPTPTNPIKPLDPSELDRYTLTAAVYPTPVYYPFGGTKEEKEAYEKYIQSQNSYRAFCEGLEPFMVRTFGEFLSGKERENCLYSPLNVYMALAMLAETSDGNTRSQILDLLGENTVEQLRSRAKGIWNTVYQEGGQFASILASSIWLNRSLTVDPNPLKQLAETYYASSFSGEMGSDDFNAALQGWINQQTGNLLANQVKNLRFRTSTLFALVTTLYYKAGWRIPFDPDQNTSGLFHGSAGDVECTFMHSTSESLYTRGDRFSACRYGLNSNDFMAFILPDEGVCPEDLLKDESALRFIADPQDWEDNREVILNLSLPPFDVSSQTDLISGLKKLGVTDCFSSNAADFSPLLGSVGGAAVAEIQHGVRVKVDEEGVEAAAFTEIAIDEGGPPSEKVEFTVDRPFIFVIAHNTGLPLFVGIVNNV